MDCPDEDTYASFLQGLLPPERVATLERHIDVCPRCTELSAQFGKLYSDDPPAPTPGIADVTPGAPATAGALRAAPGVALVELLMAAVHVVWTLLAWPAALNAWLAGPLAAVGGAPGATTATSAPLALAGAAYIVVWVPLGGVLAFAAALGLWRRRDWGRRLARGHALASLPSIVLTPLAAYVLHRLASMRGRALESKPERV